MEVFVLACQAQDNDKGECMNDNQLAVKIEQFVKQFEKDKDFLLEVGKLLGRESSLRKSIEPAQAELEKLNKQIEEAKAKKSDLNSSFAKEYQAKYDDLEHRINEAVKTERELTRIKEITAGKAVELEAARKDMLKSKDYYDSTVKEYEEKLKDVTSKQARIQAALSA